MMEILQDYTFDEVKNYILSIGEKSFRAGQIYNDMYSGKPISEMTALPKPLREKLLEKFCDMPCKIVKELTSVDGTKKFLYKLCDDNVIEGVLMSYKYGNTLCASTQVGCRMGCRFCASTLGGLVRNLTAGEILSQILSVNFAQGGDRKNRKITNVVLMGSGEPLDNYDNVVHFLRLLSSEDGICISPRNVSLSTCGLVPQIIKLADEKLPINLTVSLHNPFDELRLQIMPIAKAYKISEILDACEYFFNKTGRRYYFEYTLISGQNDTDECANKLISLLKGKPCHINLIRLNDVKEKNLKSSSDKKAAEFMEKLASKGLSVTLRRRMGTDIEGACGQLRRRFLSEGE